MSSNLVDEAAEIANYLMETQDKLFEDDKTRGYLSQVCQMLDNTDDAITHMAFLETFSDLGFELHHPNARSELMEDWIDRCRSFHIDQSIMKQARSLANDLFPNYARTA